MRGRKSSLTIALTPEDRTEIERWQRATTCRAGLARRGRVLLLLERGETLKEAARLCGMSVRHVRKWAERFRDHGLEYIALVRGDLGSPARAAHRIVAARARARFLAPEDRRWTLEPPSWWLWSG